MPAITIKVNEYANRKDVERTVAALCGFDDYKNREAGHTIEGTREELLEKNLSDTSAIYGVKCVITKASERTDAILKAKKKAMKNI